MKLNDIGVRLKWARLNAGYTQADAAEEIGVSRMMISSYEVGRRKPSMMKLERMCELYGIEPEELMLGKCFPAEIKRLEERDGSLILMQAVDALTQIVDGLVGRELSESELVAVARISEAIVELARGNEDG